MNDKQPIARQLPINELDLQMQLTNSEWGETPKSVELGNLTQDFNITYPVGTVVENSKGLKYQISEEITVYSQQGSWGLLAYLTRDIRLGNLTSSEVENCKHLLDLAGDLLASGYIRSFSAAIKRVAHILELSQSRKGFFRKLINTLRREEIRSDLNPPKPKFFGGKNKSGGDY